MKVKRQISIAFGLVGLLLALFVGYWIGAYAPVPAAPAQDAPGIVTVKPALRPEDAAGAAAGAVRPADEIPPSVTGKYR